MAESTVKQRWTVRFQGRVQGVGFRASTRHIAAGFAVTGSVRNLPDGSVEAVIEGVTNEIRDMLTELRARLGQYIRQDTHTVSAATGEFEEFEIRY